MLMVILDLFPAGAIQFKAVLDKGFWFARSADFIEGSTFQSLTWLRGIGATIFFFGGVVPLTWFVVSRANALKRFIPTKFLFGEEDDDVVELEETGHLVY